MQDLIGQHLGRYHILEQLGQGGMATVYKAYDTRLERDVAVKVLRTDQFPPVALERVLKRFEREAKALARLSHPNIVKVLDYGEHEGAPFLVMEYLPGGTLKQRLGQPWPWQDALRLLIPIADALAYAHKRSILHRDVKPSNILLTEEGQPMLTDFGIAKILDLEDGQTLTGTGVGIGTPEYMSPEQGLGKKVGPPTDVYSLGVVLYEMVTGRKPYTADTPMAVVLKHVSDPLPRPRQFVPDLPEAMEKIVLKALSKNQENRYQSMRAMQEAMEQALGSRAAPPKHIAPMSKAEARVTETILPSHKSEPITMDRETRAQSAFLESESAPRSTSTQRSERGWLQRTPKWFISWLLVGAVLAVILLWGNSLLRHQITNPWSWPSKPQTLLTTFIPNTIQGPASTALAITSPIPMDTFSPAATATPNPATQARRLAASIFGKVAQRQPDFEDDFTIDTKRWRASRNALNITEGVARLSPSEENVAWMSNQGVYRDFVLSIDGNLVSGERDSRLQIALKIPNGWLSFNLQSATKQWFLEKIVSDRTIKEMPGGTSEAISPVGKTNQIRLIIIGRQMAVFINNLPVVYYEDDALAGAGEIRFACQGRVGSVCEFDNVKVWNITDLTFSIKARENTVVLTPLAPFESDIPLPSPVIPSGQIWFVDANAPSEGDGSKEAPFRKIQEAIDAAGDGDTIRIAEGRYVENLVIQGKRLILQGGFNPKTWKRTGLPENTILDGGQQYRALTVMQGSHVLVDGFTVTNAYNDCVTSSGEFDRGGGGIEIVGPHTEVILFRLIVKNNAANPPCGGGGIEIDNAVALIADCVVAKNTANNGGGVNVVNAGRLVVANSTIAYNHPDGLDGSNGGGEILAVNTIFWQNGEADAYGSITLKNSLISRPSPQIKGDEILFADPRFVDPEHENYRLRLDSPAIDSGIPNGAPRIDLDGIERPAGNGLDIGAYEVNGVQLRLPYIEGRVLFQEDFENSDSHWAQPGPYWLLEQEPNGNTILFANPQGNQETSFFVGESTWTNYAVEVLAKVVDFGTSPVENGVVIRARQGGEERCPKMYEFFFGTSTAVFKNRCNSGVWLLQSSQSIPMQQWVTLRIELYGAEFRGYVNGKLVFHLSDKMISHGNLSIGVSPGAKVYFDNVRVVELLPKP